MKKRKDNTQNMNKRRKLGNQIIGSFSSLPAIVKSVTPIIYPNTSSDVGNQNKLFFTVPSNSNKMMRTMKGDIVDDIKLYKVTLENQINGFHSSHSFQWDCTCYNEPYVKYDKNTKVCKHIKYVLMYIMQSTIEKEDLMNDLNDLSHDLDMNMNMDTNMDTDMNTDMNTDNIMNEG